MNEFLSFLVASLPVIGLIYIGINRLLKDVSEQTASMARMEEITRLNRVTLEGLMIVDDATRNDLLTLKQKVSDIEEYLILLTAKTDETKYLHQFRIRGKRDK
jgi:hypothetical protein